MADTYTMTGLPLMYCTCGGLPMESTTKKCKMTSIGTTLAAGEGKITTHPTQYTGAAVGAAVIITAHADTDVDATPGFIAGDPSEIVCVPLELPEDALIQATTLQFMAWGK